MLNSFYRNQYYQRLQLWFGTSNNLPKNSEDQVVGLLIRLNQSEHNRSLSAAWTTQLNDFSTVSEMFQTIQAEIENGENLELYRSLCLHDVDVELFEELIGFVGIEPQAVNEAEVSSDDNVKVDYRRLTFGKVRPLIF